MLLSLFLLRSRFVNQMAPLRDLAPSLGDAAQLFAMASGIESIRAFVWCYG